MFKVFSLVVPADRAQRVAVVTPPDQLGGARLHSTANSSIKQPSNVLVAKVDFIHKEFWVVLGLQGGSGAGQNSVLGCVRPGNHPEHKVAPQHLEKTGRKRPFSHGLLSEVAPPAGTHLVEPPYRLEVAAGEVDSGSFGADGSR